MPGTLLAPRRLVAESLVAAVLAVSLVGAMPAFGQARFSAEITSIDLAEKRVTLKSSMGQLTVRVAPGVALETVKPEDKVLVTFGQDGTEPIITSMERIAP